MKYLYVLLCSISYSVYAQMTEATDPSINSSSILYLCDSNAVNYANVTGTGVTWDYSALLGIDTNLCHRSNDDRFTLPRCDEKVLY
jgi:hypothetical protein